MKGEGKRDKRSLVSELYVSLATTDAKLLLMHRPSFFNGTVDRSQKATLDSSILFRVTLHEMTLLAGHPLSVMEKYRQEGNGSANISFAVVQVVANSLLMFQSVENANGSGSKTLHVSVDNLSASANTEFYRLPAKLAPMIGPTATDFRVVYSTENLGSVVSQDFSLDCEALKASFTPNDLLLIASVVDTIYERLQRFGNLDATLLREYDPTRQPMSSFVRYQKKGAGIATSIRFEIQLLSVILLEPYQSKQGTRPLFDVRFNDLKGRLRGCLTAISGDCNTSVSVNHFNFDLGEWESTIEHTELHLTLERMPNEMVRIFCLPKAEICYSSHFESGNKDQYNSEYCGKYFECYVERLHQGTPVI
jgi:hypothetical protein